MIVFVIHETSFGIIIIIIIIIFSGSAAQRWLWPRITRFLDRATVGRTSLDE
jgi:hypothetical protein